MKRKRKQKSYPATEFKTKKFVDTGIVRGFDGYHPWFRIGHQAFHLIDLGCTKKEAKWHEKMLKIALKNLKNKYEKKA